MIPRSLESTAAFVVFVVLAFAKPAQTIEGKCIRVLDGDTIDVLVGSKVERVRLLYIDCPEKSQPFGAKAIAHTKDVVLQKKVVVTWKSRDRYNRILGDVDTASGINLNESLLLSGLAWVYRAYKFYERHAKAEADAKEHDRQLWSEAKPIPPWEWRRGRR